MTEPTGADVPARPHSREKVGVSEASAAAASVRQSRAEDIERIRRRCPVCDDDDAFARKLTEKPPIWPIVQCRSCGHVYLQEVPSFAALAEAFAWEVSSKSHSEERRKKYPALDRISKATRWRLRIRRKDTAMSLLARNIRGGRIVDVGCGNGGGILSLGQRYTPFGVEISPALAKAANRAFQERGGYAVCAPATIGLSRLPDAAFDGALLRSYLEHEEKPFVVLEEVCRLLKRRGIAIVKVPNFASINRIVAGQYWSGLRIPDHMNYFTPSTMAALADRAGFDVRTTNPLFRWSNDNFYSVLRKR